MQFRWLWNSFNNLILFLRNVSFSDPFGFSFDNFSLIWGSADIEYNITEYEALSAQHFYEHS